MKTYNIAEENRLFAVAEHHFITGVAKSFYDSSNIQNTAAFINGVWLEDFLDFMSDVDNVVM